MKTPDERNPEQLIVENVELAKGLHRRFMARLPSYADRDAFQGAAMEGLCHAAASYDSARGVTFKSWATRRIVGAMLDQQRELDYVSRRDRDRIKSGDLSKFKAAPWVPISIDAPISETGELTIMDLIPDLGDIPGDRVAPFSSEELNELMSALSDQQRAVITFRYFEDMRARDIAKILYISESRVSQVEDQALRKMKQMILKKERRRARRANAKGA